jgi:hypothetical protein
MVDYEKVPPAVLKKLASLDAQAEFLHRKNDDTERAINAARTRLTGSFKSDAEYADLRKTLERLVADQPAVETKFHRTRALAANCRRFLEALPEGTVLEPVKVKPPNGHNIRDVRERIKDAENELALLRAVPTPAPDIRKRVEDYVQSLAQPEVSGIGAGEQLEVRWPSNLISAFALLFPTKMEEVLMAEVDALANDPLPVKQRHARITELETEIEQLHYTEEALVVASNADRSPGALPQAVLQVRIVEAAKRVRAQA